MVRSNWVLTDNLRGVNPWWEGKPGPQLPSFHRWPFQRLGRMLRNGMAPVTVLRGPRRVGKTVLLRQLINALLAEGVEAKRIFYVPFDELPTLKGLIEPVLELARWFEAEILGRSFNQAARAGAPAYLFFDEVQNLDAWAPQVKNLVDNHTARLLVTGSSSLRIEAGRDSLAGRIAQLDLGPLLLREIAELHNEPVGEPVWTDENLDHLAALDFWRQAREKMAAAAPSRRRAFAAFSERGAYPIAHEKADIPWAELASYLDETVIRRAIQHDLRLGPRGAKRDERLLEEVFRLACRYAGQTPAADTMTAEIHLALASNIGSNRILNYLRFLDRTLLLRLIPAMELRLKKRRAADKICLCDPALRAAWLQEMVPLAPAALASQPHLSDLAGRIAESVLGYFFASIPHLDTAHFPARGVEPEVDFVLTVGTRRIPVEVKYRRRIDPHADTLGLRAFLQKTVYNAPLGLLITLEDGVTVPDPRIVCLSLSEILWMR